jgi:uncharacterized protein (TIGR03435 family)
MFDLKLEWELDQPLAPSPDGGPTPLSPGAIFTAIQEQLGLKLESDKGPIEVMVIDHAEKPTEN